MIVYLHGFNSSPQSHKAQALARYLAARGLGAHYVCPALPVLAADAIAAVEALMARHPGAQFCFAGSSLGGYYATWLAEQHDARAVLLNPAIDPHVGLRAWEKLWVPRVTPARYLLIVETGDEVLDYRRALERYAGAEQIVVQGGDHSLQSFERHLPRIVAFAGLAGA